MDCEAEARYAATVEKLREYFEGKEAIYIEKGASRIVELPWAMPKSTWR
jgi:hypothetical protein